MLSTPPICWLVVHTPSTMPLDSASNHGMSALTQSGKPTDWTRPLMPLAKSNVDSRLDTAKTNDVAAEIRKQT